MLLTLPVHTPSLFSLDLGSCEGSSNGMTAAVSVLFEEVAGRGKQGWPAHLPA